MKSKYYILLTVSILLLNLMFSKLSAIDSSISVIDSKDSFIINFDLGDFNIDSLKINDSFYHQISISDQPNTYEKGSPALPFFAYSFIVPPEIGSDYQISIIDADLSEMSLIPVPSKGILSRTIDPGTVPWEFSEVYDKNITFPAKPVEGGNPYILRDFTGLTLKVYPFAYNGADHSLKIYNNLQFKITFPINKGKATALRNSISEDFIPIYKNHFVNFSLTRYTDVEEAGRMIVITYPDFADEIQPLVDWKNAKGLPTTLYTLDETGNTTTEIKNFIQTQYDADDGLNYVLLVGDINQIPSPTNTIDNPGLADPMYTQLSGNDYYPEIFIGRFSAENSSQVTTQVERTIFYERDITALDWPGKGIGIASRQGTGDDNEYDYQHIRNIRTDLMNYTYTLVDELYEGSQGGEDDPSWPNSSDVAASFNNGRGIATYCGHGSAYSWGTSSFSTSGVNSLTNDFMLPFIISVACVNGKFDSYSPCFAEAWLRATHNDNPTGAVAFYGASVNQPWDPPMAAQDEVIDLLTADQKHTFGGICFNGSCLMLDEYNDSEGIGTFNTWHIFGDPSLLLRTQTPSSLTLSYPESVQIDETQMVVSSSVSEAIVCITDADYNILFQDLTGPTGELTIPLTDFPDNEQILNITATKYNHLTISGNFQLTDPTGQINPPQNVQASISSSEITISWDSVTGANSYIIYHSLSPDSGFEQIERVSSTTLSKRYPITDSIGFYRVIASNEIPE